MGVDIHMSIINKQGEYVRHDIYDGRDSEWFDNIQSGGFSPIYDSFPSICGLPAKVPEPIDAAYHSGLYYGFYHIEVMDFMAWFQVKRPDIDAGWLSTYEKWLYDTKNIYPGELAHYLDSESNPNDYCFTEVINPHDSSAWLYAYIRTNNIADTDYIVYYFDC